MHLLSLSQHQDLYDHGGTDVASGETVSFQGNCHPVGEEGTCIKRELVADWSATITYNVTSPRGF